MTGSPVGPGSDWWGLEPLDLTGDEAKDLPESVVAVPADRPGYWRVTVTLPSDVEAERCALVGEFNGWHEEACPLERAADGRYRGEVELESGAYRYKFWLDGDRWIPDPSNDDSEDDGFGSRNTVLHLGSLGRPEDLGGDVADGKIVTAALGHDPARPLYVHRLRGGKYRIRYRSLAGDVQGVALHVRGEAAANGSSDGAEQIVEGDGAEGRRYDMAPVDSPAPFQYWQVDLEAPGDDHLQYGFSVRDASLKARDPRTFQIAAVDYPEIQTPDWAKGTVWYQIFPERFRNGDASNDPEHCREWTSDWDVPADFEGQDGQTFWEFYVYQRMYGGDIAGIVEKLDYLLELGVESLYLNPVFQAEGPHKYNATDFRHIDVRFGAGEDYYEATKNEDMLDPSTWKFTPSDRVFLDFVALAKSRGLRVVIDAVFNHVGVTHPAFRDVQEAGKSSRFRDWFHIKSWQPFQYAGWAGFGELPVFAKSDTGFTSDAVRDHVFAVTRRWMDPDGNGDLSKGVDGWRLDVPGEVALEFWAEWRELVKSINPEAYISGEVWDRADKWLDGHTFDAVMNYRFAEPAIAWVSNIDRKISVTEFDRRLLELRLAYPAEVTFALMNLVNSHDTDRVVSMVLNPDRPYDRSNQIQREDAYNSGRPMDECYQKARLVALVQMTYVGSPMIYYGDEVGMWGADDPTNRQPMVWKDLEPYAKSDEVYVMDDHLDAFRKMIALRKSHRALRLGSFRTVLADDGQDLWVFERVHGSETVLVALTPSAEGAAFDLPDAPPGSDWVPVFGEDPTEGSEHPGPGPVRLAPISGRVWVAASGDAS